MDNYELKDKIHNIEQILESEGLGICKFNYGNCHIEPYYDDDLNNQLREILSKKLECIKKEYEDL